MTKLEIVQADPEAARGLLEASHALMLSKYSAEDCHFLSLEALRAPEVTFLVARDDAGRALGCGALARRPGYGEIKSMFTDPQARGGGVAEAIIDRLETVARAEHLPRLCLETGVGLDAAQRLYARKGFSLCGPFGAYAASAASIFMDKVLADPS